MVIIVKKGGPGSGNFDHAGRPGKVGGSAPGKGGIRVIQHQRNQGYGNKVDTYEQLKGLSEDPKDSTPSYIIGPDKKLYDTYNTDHSIGADAYFDAHMDEYNSLQNKYYNELLPTYNISKLDALLEMGGVRVRRWYNSLYLHTVDRSPATLRKLHKYIDNNLLNVNGISFISWDTSGFAMDTTTLTTPLHEFLTAKSVYELGDGTLVYREKKHIIIKKGGPGSGNFDHAGRPGKVGGSAPGKGGGKTREQVIEEIAVRYPSSMAYSEEGDVDFDREYWDKFNKEGPTLVYHGTREEYVEGIKESGIAVGTKWMGRPPSVYFTVDEKEARYWASSQSNFETDWSVIAFRIPDEWDNEIISDAIAMRDFNWDSAFRIERHIPPEYILSIEFGTDYYDPEDVYRKERIGYTLIKCHFTKEKSKRKIIITKGGPGSGHFGHAGRPGKVGGSASGKGGGKDVFYPSVGAQTSIIETLPAYPGKHESINEFLNQGLEIQEPFVYSGISHAAWATASYEERGKMKADIISELSQQTGVDEDTVNAILAQWANTSNDEDMRSLSLQKAASEEFGVEMGDWQNFKYELRVERWEEIETEWKQEERDQFDWLMNERNKLRAQGIDNPVTQASLDDVRWQANYLARSIIKNRYDKKLMPITSRNDERLVLRAMYDITQQEFMKAGFDRDDTILIYRGIGKVDLGTHGSLTDYQGNAIESWSVAYKVGLDFRNIGGDVAAAHVPVRNILGTCKTGFGCWTEGEIVTFGTIPGMQVRVIDPTTVYQMSKEQDHNDTAMIALPITDPTVTEIWRKFGSDRDVLPLHITLLYLGEVEGLDKEEIINILHKFAQQQAPMEGRYNGAAIFTDNGDGYPHVLLYDSPQLPFCQSTLSNLLLSHRPELTHGFTPHTTLAYYESPDKLPVDVDIPYTFNAIMLKWGDEERIFPLSGNVIHKGGPGSGHFGHSGRPGKVGGSAPGKGGSAPGGGYGENAIREQLNLLASFRKGRKPEGAKYSSFEELVLEVGRYYEPSNEPLPKGVSAGEVKQCYRNTLMNMRSDLIYTEGYGMVEGLPMTFNHAWLTTKDGKVVDLTWRDNAPIAYFGIPFNVDFVYTTTARTGMAGILASDWMDDSRILKNGLPDDAIYKAILKHIRVIKGGPGSGHHGHAGRPGKIGGSAPGKGFKGEMANPNGKDTMEQYRNADGSWTPERRALHDKITAKFFYGATPVDDPTSYVLGGGPAAGKTTVMIQGLEELPENIVSASGDNIKAMLPEYAGGSNAEFVHEESSYLSKRIAYKAANQSYNVIMDGTGDNTIESLTRKVNSMRPLGQDVIGVYITVNIDTAIKRSLARAKSTGRYVPESVLRHTHRMVANIYPAIINADIYTNVNLYDTSVGVPKLIAREIGKDFTILDDEAYQRFLNRGK